MNMHNSPSQASPESSIPEEGRSAFDGSGPATEDEIRELQQIEDFFRQYDCLPENYRPLSEDADVSTTLGKEAELDDWAKGLAAEFIAIPPSTFIGPLPESSEIMDRLTGFLRRYLVCASDQLTVLALWIMHTYSYKACSVTPYLNIHSMERRSGNTITARISWPLGPSTLISLRKPTVPIPQAPPLSLSGFLVRERSCGRHGDSQAALLPAHSPAG